MNARLNSSLPLRGRLPHILVGLIIGAAVAGVLLTAGAGLLRLVVGSEPSTLLRATLVGSAALGGATAGWLRPAIRVHVFRQTGRGGR